MEEKNLLGMRLLAIQEEGKKWLKSSSRPYLEKEIVFSFQTSPKELLVRDIVRVGTTEPMFFKEGCYCTYDF